MKLGNNADYKVDERKGALCSRRQPKLRRAAEPGIPWRKSADIRGVAAAFYHRLGSEARVIVPWPSV